MSSYLYGSGLDEYPVFKCERPSGYINVKPTELHHYVSSSRKLKYCDRPRSSQSTDTLEVFGGDARVTQIAVRRQLRCGKVVDIRTGMDLTKEEAIRSLYKYVKMRCPLFIIDGPPCSAFGALSKINSWKHPATYAQTLKTGMTCARVMATISRM